MLTENTDANVNRTGDYEGLVVEFPQIHCEFEATYWSDEAVVSEWVRVEIFVAGTYARRKARLPEIDLKHIEIEENVPADIAETVEKILAESLFNLWLSEKGVVSERN